jgi:outer membrane protein
MRMNQFILILLITMSISGRLIGQPVMTLDEAINIGLRQSQIMEISQLNEQIARGQVYKANAGMTPRLDWNFNTGTSINYVNQEFVDGRVIDRIGRSLAPNTNLALTYNIYDGGLKRYRYKMLESQANAQKTQTEIVKDELVAKIRDQYIAILRQNSFMTFLENNLKFYKDRLSIVTQRWELGKIAKLDVLQSQNDLKTQENLIKIAAAQIVDLKSSLNITLERDASIDFKTQNIAPIIALNDVESLMNQIKAGDEILRAFDQDIAMQELNGDIISAANLPRIGFQTSLGYNLNNTNAGLILLNQSAGLNAALGATWTLYDGGHTRKQKSINSLRTNILQRQKTAYLSDVKGRVVLAVNKYNLAISIKSAYQDNLSIARENLDIILEKLRLGGASILEVNDAQQRYDVASQAVINSEYDILQAYWVIQSLVE